MFRRMDLQDEPLELYSTSNPVEAEMLRAALHSEGIKCECNGELQAGLVGIDAMPIKLLVLPADYDRASAFLREHHKN